MTESKSREGHDKFARKFFRSKRTVMYAPPDLLPEAEHLIARHAFLWEAWLVNKKIVNGLFQRCWPAFTQLGQVRIEENGEEKSLVELIMRIKGKKGANPTEVVKLGYELNHSTNTDLPVGLRDVR